MSDIKEHNQNNNSYEIETIPEVQYESKHFPNIFHTIFFRRAFKPIMIARKQQLEHKDLGQLTSKLNIEKNYDSFEIEWENEMKKNNEKVSLAKLIIKREWKVILCVLILSIFCQVSTLSIPFVSAYLISWIKEPQVDIAMGFVYFIVIVVCQLTNTFCYETQTKWINFIAIRSKNGLQGLIYT